MKTMIRPLEMRSKTRLSPEYGVLNENPTLLDDSYTRYQKSKAADGSLLSAIHIENMLKLSRLGVVILPPVTEFYTKPKTIDDIVNHGVGKCLDQFDIDHDLYPRWGTF
jgi:hypothetical protein